MTLRMLWSAMFALLVVVLPFAASAQSPTPGSASPSRPSDQELLKPAELEALVAPIALYPDTLLAEVLMASTYPLEVVQADRWATTKKNLKDDQLKTAVGKEPWDASVKALVATPSVLTMMSTKLDWTQKLGDAFLAQQADVMDAIQRLRAKAQTNNKLTSTREQTVTVRQEQNRQVIAIEPTEPNTVYVPYYDPAVVYGEWPYAEYPPYYFPDYYAGYIGGGLLAAGIAFGGAYALARWASGGNFWGGNINWQRNNINVNRPRVNPLGGNAWQHNPAHRRGVRYSNTNVRQRFGAANIGGGNRPRPEFRGSGGQQVLKPGTGNRAGPGAGGQGNRPNAGRPSQLPGAGGNRPNAGRPGNRPSAGKPSHRPSAGKRPSVSRPVAGHRRSGAGPAHVSRGGGAIRAGGGGFHGGGGFRSGGGGGFRGGGGGGRGGGRRSDVVLKHDIALIGRLDNGLGFYRFSYNGSNKAYVGVIAQEVQAVKPDAVVRGRDGYLRVFYGKLGVPFEPYDQWIASGARLPAKPQRHH